METRNPHPNLIPMSLAEATSVFRYQLYRQEPSGLFSSQFETNLAAKAVEAFLAQTPAFEHGNLRLWNHREQRICASITWHGEETEFGFTVYRRVNRFHDDLLAAIAHQNVVPFEIHDRSRHWSLHGRDAA